MRLRRLLPLLFVALPLALAALSCAVGGGTESAAGRDEAVRAPRTMPAARAALPSQLRVFYDELEDDGDWVLIEPHGWVFRPRVNFVAWQPYREGYWVPTDRYGWVWVSGEPFGWITDHYGNWFRDDYQGWVWQPGIDWAPAWVTWAVAGDYVGWAPLAPGAMADGSSASRDSYVFAPIGQLDATDVRSRLIAPGQLGMHGDRVRPVLNVMHEGRATLNRGPAFEDIERATGRPVIAAGIDDRRPLARPATPADSIPAASEDLYVRLRRDADRITREVRSRIERGAPAPASLQILGVVPVAPGLEAKPRTKPGAAPLGPPERRGAPADSSR